MNITTLIDNFSDNSRLYYKNDELVIVAQGKVIYDSIFVFIFSLFLIQSIRLSSLNNLYLFISLLFLIFVIIILLYKTRGNNKLIIRFSEKTVIIKKRSPFFFLIPKKTIKFRDIISFDIVQRTNYLDVRSYKSYEIIAKTEDSLVSTTLITFLDDEKNNANQVLSFLKSVIIK